MPSWTKEQEQAIYEKGTNIIVSAGAGSGKTAVLSERALRIVKDGVDIDRLLILTFTNAAAYEMMMRIRKKIKEAGFAEQVERIDKAYITTFDSFALSLVKKYHDTINISNYVSIIDNSVISIVKEEILEEVFNEYYESNNELFENLITSFCVKDDKELKTLILNLSNKLDMKYDKIAYLNNYINTIFAAEKIKKDINEFTTLLKNEIKKISCLIEKLGLYLDGTYCSKLFDVCNPLLESTTYNDILTNLDIKLPPLPRGSEDEVKNIKNEINKVIDKVSKLCIYKDEKEILTTILDTKDYIKILIDILLKLDDKVTKYKMSHNVYEFIDINKLAIKIVEENEEIRNELKNYFYEIMIDEYQDTNDLQEYFISMIENNNVYMVGDIKQSIYRFRNANPIIFKNKYDSYAMGENGVKIDLNKNFRSRKEVLDDINTIFDYIMDDEIGNANYRESHEMVFGNNTYITNGTTNQNYQTSIYEYQYDKNNNFTKDEIEAFIIANDIKNKVENNYLVFDKDKQILRNINYSDFVILMDRSTKFDLYKRIFEYMKIPLTIMKDESILNHIEIYLIKNLLNLLIKVKNKTFDEDFKCALLSIGRSYLYESSDQELFDYIKKGNYYDSDIIIKINKILKDIDQKDLLTIVRELIDEFNFYEKCNLVGNVDLILMDLEYIQKVAVDLMKLDYDLPMFYTYLNTVIENNIDIKLTNNVIEDNSCKIMTIHKSKGLEYHVCYYAGLFNTFNVKELKDKILFSNKYGIILPKYNNQFIDTIYKPLYTEEFYNDEISEKIRLLYVALTRCKEKMIIVTDSINNEIENDDDVLEENTRLKYRSFKEILKSIYDKIEHFIENVNLDKIGLTLDYKKILAKNIKEILNLDNTKQIELEQINLLFNTKEKNRYSKESTKLLTNENIKNMHFGTKIHEILEMIDFKNPQLDKLDLDDFLKNKITKFLDNDLLKNINSATIYKEFKFIGKSDTIGIIDCMIVYDDHIDIIDYKLKNVLDEAYFNQLNGYKEYIETKTNKKTNIYLYSIIDEEMTKLK